MSASKSTDPLEERLHRKSVRQHVKEFGVLFGVIFLVLLAIALWKNWSDSYKIVFASLALLFPGFGFLAPRALRPVWAAWMAFAEKLGLVVTTIILFVVWVGVLLPTALALKILSKKVMDLRCYEEGVTTYWEEREEKLHSFELLERQF